MSKMTRVHSAPSRIIGLFTLLIGFQACAAPGSRAQGERQQLERGQPDWLEALESSGWPDSLNPKALGTLMNPTLGPARDLVRFDSALAAHEGEPKEMHLSLRRGGSTRLDGALYAFSKDTIGDRFLVVGTVVHLSGAQTIGLYVLGLGPDDQGFSRPYDLRTINTDAFSLEAIGDFDQDGQADVAYCRWTDEVNVESGVRPALGNLFVIAFRNGNWYGIAESNGPSRLCVWS